MEQKKFDLNSFIGMILLGGIIFWWMSTQKSEITDTPATTTTEIVAQAEDTSGSNGGNTALLVNDSIKQAALNSRLGAFAQSAMNASEGVSVLENDLIKLTINNKGGQIKEVLIKNYKTYDSLPLYMVKDNNASFNINFGTTDNRILNTKDLFFQPTITQNGNNQVVSLKLKVSETKFLEYRYEMKPKEYMVDFSIRSQGLSNVINGSNPINLDWSLDGFRHEKSLRTENTMYSYYYFKAEDEVDYLGAGSSDVVEDVDWVSYKQHFFSSSLLTDTPFNKATVTSTDLVLNEEIDTVFTKRYELKTPLALSNGELNYNMKWFYGPSDYNLLTEYVWVRI